MELLEDFREVIGKFWLVKPKTASLDCGNPYCASACLVDEAFRRGWPSTACAWPSAG